MSAPPTPPPPSTPPSTDPPTPPQPRRLSEWAAVLSAVTGVVGLLFGFFGLPVVINSPTARTPAPIAQPTVSATVSQTPPASATSPSAETGTGNPVTKTDIKMPADYGIVLSDDPIELREGVGYDLTYDSFNGLQSKGRMVKLDSGQEGSLEVCRSDTRYTDIIRNSALTKGTRICVQRSDRIGLVTVKEAPQIRDESKYVTLDIIVWP
ncbi:hypothetical protein [Streptomyces sp. McG3]|uniref:hypothetical protein n=1 Tax=Streptomyces sp. McG3 TaxID=2725483 RepID=UPI001BEBDC15|nr:hypothetical protein [Streptomyces sp. McG3]MBT2895535.1 hypothetical protein [Streptomyces sp. McG3]